MKFIKKGDKIVALSVLLLACILYFIFNFAVFADKPQTAEVYVDGELYASYKLSEIKAQKTVAIETEYGSNVLELTNDGVRITDASCKDKIDVRSGRITKANQMIICIPNRFSVKLTGNGNDVDKVTH
ncbi:MAG: NusG domain II-containing protein [Ruminococcaceae bacterium]|nr:NusG domain II-containing protein [Oscillospiraceae bacterium]